MENFNNELEAKDNEDPKWRAEMYKLYLRQTLVALKEYNESLARMRQVLQSIVLLTDDLKKSVAPFKVE